MENGRRDSSVTLTNLSKQTTKLQYGITAYIKTMLPSRPDSICYMIFK